MTWETILAEFENRELDASEMEEKQWLEEQARRDYEAMEMENEGNDEDSKSKDKFVCSSEDDATTSSFETPRNIFPKDPHEILTSTKRSLNQALRKLYHSSGRNVRRRLANEENEDEDDGLSSALQEPRTEDERDEPVGVVTPTKARSPSPVSVMHLVPEQQGQPRAIQSSNISKNEKDDCYYYHYYYIALETSEFYSEDLVVEWDSSFEEMTPCESEDSDGDETSGSAVNHYYEDETEAAIDLASSSDSIDAAALVASIDPTSLLGMVSKEEDDKENPNRKRNYSDAFGDD
jgi:hypothetical protein